MLASFPSIDVLAGDLLQSLQRGVPAEAFRVATHWYAWAHRCTKEELSLSLREPPRATQDPRWDALLAGLAEQLCLERQLDCPPWAFEPPRYLKSWWFPTPYRSLHPSAFVESPGGLKNRGVFIHRADLESV